MTTYLTARRHINQLVGEASLIHSGYEPNWDGPGGSVYTERIEGAGEVWRLLVREAPRKWRMKPDDLFGIKTIEDVMTALGETLCEYSGRIETEAEFDARIADNLRAMIDRLKAIGAEPPQPSMPGQPEPTKKSAPICPTHNKPMKASQKPGTFYCPRRDDDGDYCGEKA